VELAIAEVTWDAISLPTAVTLVLAEVLENLGGLPPKPNLVDDLSVGDRQFLMQQLAILLGLDDLWMTATCQECDNKFDFLIRFSELLVKSAGPTYPFVLVDTSRGRGRWRVPTGADQKYLAELPAGTNGVRQLVRRCLVDILSSDQGEDPSRWVAGLTEADLAQVEASLEAVSPEVTTEVQAACPECRRVHNITVNPYVCLTHHREDIWAQIHTIATSYHWSEAEILSLPQRRRQRYLDLIDRSKGLTS
jgi:hypothetical protein